MGACCAKSQPIDLPDGVECLVRTPAEIKAASDILTHAFAGSADHAPELAFDWCLGPDLQGQGWDDPRRHNSIGWLFRYVVEYVLSMATSGRGAVLVCRSADGAIAGAVALKIYRSRPTDPMCTWVATLRRVGAPKGDAEKYVTSPRMKAFTAGIDGLHKAHASGPHVYVWTVGVDRSAQGQGIGGQLMRAVVSIADREGLPAYLETTGERNPKIYERFGFAVVGQTELRTKPKGDAAVETFGQPYLAMVRPARVPD